MSESSKKRVKAFVDAFIAGELVAETHAEERLSPANPRRAERCWAAQEEGCDGSTHREIIADWRKAFRWERRCLDNGKPHDRFESAVEAYFDDVEAWHEKNGTLFQEVG